MDLKLKQFGVKPIHRHGRMLLWLLCLASAFVVTHMPPPKVAARPLINDKVLHFTGFAALGIVGIWRLTGDSRRISGLAAMASFVGLALYGVIDEATQPYFGRSCEFGDWVADVCGAATGILVALACHRLAGDESGERTGS